MAPNGLKYGPKNNFSNFGKCMIVQTFSITAPASCNSEENTVDPQFLNRFMKIYGPKKNFSMFRKFLIVEMF